VNPAGGDFAIGVDWAIRISPVTLEQGCSMIPKVIIEVEPQHEAFVRQAAAMAEEMEQLALSAADGTVFDACEEAVIEMGRRLQSRALGDAVARRLEEVEKKGARFASAAAVAKRKTKGPRNGS